VEAAMRERDEVCIRAEPKAEEDNRRVAMRPFDESMVD
jgi:hypothetical protein